MPISYHRDDAQRRIVAIGEGAFRVEEVLEIFERIRADGTWAYGTLYDVRRMTGSPSMDDMKRVMESAGKTGPGGEQVGPMAVLAERTLYSAACTYAAMGPPGRFDVFADRAEAEAWLLKHTPR